MNTRTRGRVLWATTAALAVALLSMGGGAPGGALELLRGAGPGLMGLLWGCGVCAGYAALIASGGMASVVAYLVAAANLARITACVAACFGALTV